MRNRRAEGVARRRANHWATRVDIDAVGEACVVIDADDRGAEVSAADLEHDVIVNAPIDGRSI